MVSQSLYGYAFSKINETDFENMKKEFFSKYNGSNPEITLYKNKQSFNNYRKVVNYVSKTIPDHKAFINNIYSSIRKFSDVETISRTNNSIRNKISEFENSYKKLAGPIGEKPYEEFKFTPKTSKSEFFKVFNEVYITEGYDTLVFVAHKLGMSESDIGTIIRTLSMISQYVSNIDLNDGNYDEIQNFMKLMRQYTFTCAACFRDTTDACNKISLTLNTIIRFFKLRATREGLTTINHVSKIQDYTKQMRYTNQQSYKN